MPTISYSSGIILTSETVWTYCSLRPQLFSFSQPKPKPTHFPNHESLSPNHQFSQGIGYV